MAKLVPALKISLAKDALTLEEVSDAVSCLTEDTIKAAKDSGCDMYCHLLLPKQVLYVPAGWLLCEECCAGVLVYGLRKGFLFKCTDSKKNYEELIGTQLNSGENVDKPREALAFM